MGQGVNISLSGLVVIFAKELFKTGNRTLSNLWDLIGRAAINAPKMLERRKRHTLFAATDNQHFEAFKCP